MKKFIRAQRLILIAPVCIALAGCNDSVKWTSTATLPPDGWKELHVVEFDIDAIDSMPRLTGQHCRLVLSLRYREQTEIDHIPLAITYESFSQSAKTDTLLVALRENPESNPHNFFGPSANRANYGLNETYDVILEDYKPEEGAVVSLTPLCDLPPQTPSAITVQLVGK